MRVRILKDFSAAGKKYYAGEIVDISPVRADALFSQGLAMQDKSLDGAKETKIK